MIKKVIKSGCQQEVDNLPFYPFVCELCGCHFKAYGGLYRNIDLDEWGKTEIILKTRCPECYYFNVIILSKREFLRKYKKIIKQYEKEKTGREWELENDQGREILSN